MNGFGLGLSHGFLKLSDVSCMGVGAHLVSLERWSSSLNTHQNCLAGLVVALQAASHCLAQVRGPSKGPGCFSKLTVAPDFITYASPM